MRHFFDVWEPFAAAVRTADHVLLLSDYDGTLTPIASRPEKAIFPPEVSEKLRTLSRKPAFSVGVISGRSLGEIKSMVGIDGIYYAGNHGLEIEGPGVKFINAAARTAQPVVKALAGQLSAALAGIRGVIIEDKGLSLSVHYRLVKQSEVAQVGEIFHRITASPLRQGKIRLSSGKKVWEVRPPLDWHKGKAVETIVEKIKALHRLEQLLTIYLGDDTTDEDAFKVVHHPQGWSIFVGQDNPSSSAEYFLNSTAEVTTFLSRLIELK